MINNHIGIRREDKNEWETRAPLVPSHIRELIQKHGLSIFIQPSKVRVFSDHEYIREGAAASEDLSECDIILAVKEVPLERLQRGKIYLFFSHTTKGQAYNMPMLKKMAELECTLIDYEKIADSKGKRLLFFGTQAGQSGMLETFSAIGERLRLEGINQPFQALEQPYRYGSLIAAKEAVKKAGREIREKGLDPNLSPMIFGFAGYGHTSQGAQDIFNLLPHEEIPAEGLEDFVHSGNFTSNRVYKVVFKEEHMVESIRENQPFQLSEYYQYPQRYRSVFGKYLKHLSVLLNCIYWEEKYPKFVSNQVLRQLFESPASPKLRVIGDISCDIGGSVECNRFCTTPDQPVFTYNPHNGEIVRGFDNQGVTVMSIDNLPAEIPLESSLFFSGALSPYIPKIARVDFNQDFHKCDLPDEIKKAVIMCKGVFTPLYEYMLEYIKQPEDK